MTRRFFELHKGKTSAQLQYEGFELAQDGGLQIGLLVVLVQAEKVQQVGDPKYLGSSRRRQRRRAELGAGGLTALDGLAFDLAA